MSVADIILAKFIFPTHLDSAEIREQVAEAIRQRAFYSARMACKSYLESLQRICAAYARGDINAADARLRAQDVLDSLGLSDPTSYKMVDHGSAQRLNLILKTQRGMAASVARLDRQTPAILDQWPAWRLERYGSRSAPRQDWHLRWKAAGDAVGWQGASKREMVALKTSPIWKALGQGVGGFNDALGNPYPPFAFSSGLGWSDVTREEAIALGLLDEHAHLAPPPRASLSPTEQEIADAMAGLVPKTYNALNKRARDDHGHFASIGGEPCTHGAGKAEDEKETPGRKMSDAWSQKPAKGSSIDSLKCSRSVGEAFLEDEPETKDSDSKSIIWSRHLVEKYRDGKGRKNGPDPERFTLVAAAVITTRFPAKKVKDYRGNQTVYYREFNGKAVAVFVGNDTRKVNGFMKGTIGEVRDSIGHKYFKKK